MNNKIRTYVGFAIRSKQCVFGYDLIFKSRKVLLTLFSSDMSEGAKAKLVRFCTDCEIACYEISPTDIFAYTSRAGVKAIGITEPNLAQAIIDTANADDTSVGV